MDRPRKIINFWDSPERQRAENCTTNDEASVGIGVEIYEYVENSGGGHFQGGDGLRLRVVGSANTRKGIYYDFGHFGHLVDGFPLTQYMSDTNITGDDSGTYIDLPFEVCFYGGGGNGIQSKSAFYTRVWIGSNGFISFDGSQCWGLRGPLPSEVLPNAVAAVYWTDLDPTGGSIKYSIDPVEQKLVVVWDHVLNKYNQARETFAAILYADRFPLVRGQSRIKFLYNGVSGAPGVLMGLEDQEGFKACNPGFTPSGQDEVWFFGDEPAAEIRKITIRMEKNDNQAEAKVNTDYLDVLRGYNIRWRERTGDPQGAFEVAIKGGLTMLSSNALREYLLRKGVQGGVAACGFMWSSVLLGWELVYQHAREHWPAYYLSAQNANTAQNVSYISASADNLGDFTWPVDAFLDDELYWVFTDPNNAEHSIRLCAEVEYYSYKYGETRNATTSVELRMTNDVGNDFNNYKTISKGIYYHGCLDNIDTVDMYKISVPANNNIYVFMTPHHDSNYDLFLYHADYTEIPLRSSTRTGNQSESLGYATFNDASFYIKVKQTTWEGHVNEGIYTLRFALIGINPPGCPYISVWNGSSYAFDNNVLPRSLEGNSCDVSDYYMLEKTPVQKNSKYSLLLNEFEHEHSYFDQATLTAVDHDAGTGVAVTQDGQILTYKNPASPLSAVDNLGFNRLNQINSVERDINEPATFFDAQTNDSLVMNFGQFNSDDAKLVLVDDRKCEDDYCCIEVYVSDHDGDWQWVELLAPRSFWATQIVDLEPHIVKGQNLWVKLFWTSPHRLDFVGLDTTVQDGFEVRTGNLVSATHSIQGNIKVQLQASDNVYAELMPGEQITLEFTLPTNCLEKRTFILYTEGHYYTIP